MKYSLVFASIAAVSTAAAEPLPADADRVEYGGIKFQLVQNGEAAGEMFYSMERDGDNIIIHDATTLMPDIRESGSAVIDAETFAPKSIVVDGDFSRTIFDADLKFENGKAIGVYRMKQPDQTSKTDRPFEADLPEGAILRASIFGLATGLPLDDDASFAFTWFNTLGGAVSDVTLSVTGREKIETPAGEFDTYVMALKAQPENVIYVTVEEPRKIVRIDVVGQDMRFERMPAERKD